MRWARGGFLSDAVVLLPMRYVQQRSLKEYLEQEFYQQLKKSAGSRHLIILVATKPHTCDKLNIDRRVKVISFSADQIKKFVVNLYPNDELFVSELLQQLSNNSHLETLSYVPVNLVMVMDIFQCSKDKKYVNMQENDKRGYDKKWKDPKIIFTMKKLMHCGTSVIKVFNGFDLLKATYIHEVLTDTSTFNFSYLTIQEFLSSLYISLLTQEEQLRLVIEHFHDFPNFFISMCGLTGLKCNQIHWILYSKLMSKGDDVIPALRCIGESNYAPQSPVTFSLDMSYNICDLIRKNPPVTHIEISDFNKP